MGEINKNMSSVIVAPVVPILRETATTGAMSPQKLRRGLEEPISYCLVKTVYGMSIVDDRNRDGSDSLKLLLYTGH